MQISWTSRMHWHHIINKLPGSCFSKHGSLVGDKRSWVTRTTKITKKISKPHHQTKPQAAIELSRSWIAHELGAGGSPQIWKEFISFHILFLYVIWCLQRKGRRCHRERHSRKFCKWFSEPCLFFLRNSIGKGTVR